MSYVVMCQVSGGVTGTRRAPMKVNGQVQYFATFEEADAEAKRIQATPRSQYRTADFHYWAEEA